MESKGDSLELNETNIQRLKDKYSKELEHDKNNPIKICIKLIFDAATNRNKEERSRISHELSQFLTKPDGLINLFLALVDFDTSSQKVTTHNQRFIAVANIITFLPNLCMPYEDYCLSIMKQLKQLLIYDNIEYSSLACIITKSMLDSPHSRGKNISKIIFDPIFESLTKPNTDGRSTFCRPHETILIVDKLIENHLPKELFVQLLPQLFYSLVALQDSPSRLKMPLQRSLVALLNFLKPGPACCQLEKTLFHNARDNNLYKTTTEGEEVTIQVCEQSEDFAGYNMINIVRIVLSLLKLCNNDMLVLEFFFYFNETLWTTQKDDNLRMLNVGLIEEMLTNATCEELQGTSATNNLDLMGIIATNIDKSMELIVRTLMNHSSFLRSNQSDFNERFKLVESSMNSCLEILEVMNATLNALGTSNDVKIKCQPILKDLRDLFEQHGIEKDNKTLKCLSSLMNETAKNSTIEFQKAEQEDKMDKEYASILNDLNDKLEPVRVHGLVRLKQLIQAKEAFIVSKIPQIYPMIESSLADPEPYVFLASIKLLAEMSVRNTDAILPKLCELYLRKGLELQNRLNVGEVLVQLTKQMNQTTPFYAQQVLGIFFKGCKDMEELIRVSSLTNIGEICKNLGDSLGKYILDILACISGLIDTDTIQVKCAAVDLLRTALSGVDRFRAEGIQREMKSMYQMLKTLKSRSLDENLCLQIDLALDEMDRLARALIMGNPDDGLTKNIKMLSLSR